MTLQKTKGNQIIEGWRQDPRMVFLANPGRDLTAKERKEWERNIGQCQVCFEPGEFGQIDVVSASLFGM